MGALVIDADAERDERSVLHHVGGGGDPDLLPDMDGIEVDQVGERRDDSLDIPLRDLVLLEELAEALALGDRR